MIDLVEGQLLVPSQALRHQAFGADQDPLVDLQQLAGFDHVLLRIEVEEVAERVAEGVAQLPVGFRQPRQDGFRDSNVLGEFL